MPLAHDVIADSHELMEGGTPADKTMISKKDVPAQKDVIGEGVGISHNAIVPDV